MLRTIPTPAARFQEFEASHGAIESPLADRLLGVFFERAINRYFEYPQSGTLQAYVSEEIKRLSPDILAVLELAADWQSDPLQAAGRILRADLDAKAQAEEEDRKRREDEALKVAIRAKADAFMEQLTQGGAAVAAVDGKKEPGAGKSK
jgi:hypothetical protein